MLSGTQCFYGNAYNCKCTDIVVNGKVNCPSSASIVEANAKGILLNQLAAVGKVGHMFTLPGSIDQLGENAALRKRLLLGSGISEGSSKFVDAMKMTDDNKNFVKRLKICSCHISVDDIIQGKQENTLALKKTTTVKSVGFLVNNSPPVREKPLARAMESVGNEMTGVKKYKEETTKQQKDQEEEITNLRRQKEKLQADLDDIKRKVGNLEKIQVDNSKMQTWLSSEVERLYEYVEELEEMVDMKEEECQFLRDHNDNLEKEIRSVLAQRYHLFIFFFIYLLH